MTTAFLLHPASALHDTGWGHPEHQGRLRALASTVGRDMVTLHGRVEQIDPDEIDERDLLRVHTRAHVERIDAAVRRASESGRIVDLDADTRVSGASWDAAVGAAGAAVTAVREVAEGRHRNAFVATRPPGHHATPDRAMGFCLFNNVAVAARWLLAEGHAERLWIVDWDVHHGNGTQDVFWEDGSVFFLSLHQRPLWPGTGAPEERGAGAGSGLTLNVPLTAGTDREAYCRAFESALDAAADALRPDFILVSAGFDVLAGDPLGGLRLEPADMHALTGSVMARASEHCDGRLVLMLEGGYDVVRTGLGAACAIRALAGVDAPIDPEREGYADEVPRT